MRPANTVRVLDLVSDAEERDLGVDRRWHIRRDPNRSSRFHLVVTFATTVPKLSNAGQVGGATLVM